jgi:hypothetical protein
VTAGKYFVSPWEAPERRRIIDVARLQPGGSSLAPYLALWRDARAGDMQALLGRIQARGLERRMLVLDFDHSGTFVYRFFGSSLTFVDAADRAALIGRSAEAFGDLPTVLASREGYLAAVARDAPVCEAVDRRRLDASGRRLPRIPFRRLILPLPVSRRVVRLVVASELVQGAQDRSGTTLPTSRRADKA